MFKDTVDRLLGDHIAAETVLAAEHGAWPKTLWNEVEANGLTVAAAPEERGGVGADWSDCFDIAYSAGAHAAPIPLAETLAVNWLLGRAGAPLADGPASLAPTSDLAAAGDALSGTISDVPWGRAVKSVLVHLPKRSVLLPTIGATVETGANVAGEPRDTLAFDRVTPLAEARWNDDGDPVLIAGASIRAAQIAGAIHRLREMTVEFVGQREQFGRPLAKFQAVQQQLAVLAENAMMARCAAEAAFFETAPSRLGFAAAVAKQVTSEAAGDVAAIAHAAVGAIGFTHEYTLHLLTRRLWSWRSEHGSARFWAIRIGAAACRAGGDGLWAGLVASDLPTTIPA